MVEFDDVISSPPPPPPPPPPSRGQRTGRMPAVAAGSWGSGVSGRIMPPPPPPASGGGFAGVSRSGSTITSADLLASGLETAGPGRLKVDLTTPLEKLFLTIFVLACVLSGILLMTAVLEDKSALPIFFSSLIPLGIAFWLYWWTDNYYVVDLRNKMFLFHFHFGPIDFDWSVAPFSKIVACTTTSVHKTSKQGKHGPTRHWWEYATVVVLDSGKIIPVSDFSRESLHAANLLAEKLARVFQTKHVFGRSQCIPVVKRDSRGNIVVTQEEPSQLWLLVVVLVIFGFVLIAHLADKVR
ncbi:MAG TPA: hypothetical protein PLU72_07775 [Candidatus Ozemobacteraceae bacterium]|nr:hypothetical protein [Candidatus Ozemobacteraceae bacterium]HQG29637.1 hypothetical protein [Candidatus Ozemobacteraceae bacterium]